MHPKNRKLMAVFVFFSPILINVYTRILTITKDVFSLQQKYSNTDVVSRKILVLSLFLKKG